jgi:dual specificity tyrosine-phosphorylation-regulated kinase 2/3/4
VASSTTRRQSVVNGLVPSTAGSKRTSTGAVLAPANAGSSLPRVTRSVSAKQDAGLASAGATAAMNRRV